MSTTTIRASIHVSHDSDVNVSVEQLKPNSSKYAVLSIGDATLFINSREKALEISCLLKQAAQKWDGEKEINNRKKYTVKDAKGNVLKSFDFLSEVRDYLWDIINFRKFENGLTGCTVSNFLNNSTVTLDWDNVDIINNIYHRKLVCDECCDNFAEAWYCKIIGTSVNGNIIMQKLGGCHCRCEINATIYEQIHFTNYDDFGNVTLVFDC